MANFQAQTNNQTDKDDKANSLLFAKIIRNWPWFIFSVVMFLGVAFAYLWYATPVYTITTQVLIKDDSKTSGSATSGLADLASLFNPTSSVDNEQQIVNARYLMEEVVRDLNSDVTYYQKGFLKSTELYASPFIVHFIKRKDTVVFQSYQVKFEGDKIFLKGDNLNTQLKFNQPIRLDSVGIIDIEKVSGMVFHPVSYGFTIASIDSKIYDYRQALTVTVPIKDASVMELDFNYSVPKKGEDIINKLLDKYQQANLDDKDRIADSTIKFIDSRLANVNQELSGVEGKVQALSQEKKIIDIPTQAKDMVTVSSGYLEDLAKSETQLKVLQDLESYLKDDTRNKRVFPSGVVIADLSFGALIERYNNLILERERQLLSTTETNPFIVNLDQQIAGLRKDMLSAIQSTKQSVMITIANIKPRIAAMDAKVASVPPTERLYLDLTRQQQIKQDLYVYLMQKKEETAISKTSTISNTRVIDPPKSGVIPISPNKKMIYILGLFLGLAVPVGTIFLRDYLNNRILNKDEVTRLTKVPIIGELSNKTIDGKNKDIAVDETSRTAISEQFRSLRTNLNFFLKESTEKVIVVTSSMSGEGKSFTALNLSIVLSLSGNKVLLMEMDLRKPSISNKLDLNFQDNFTNYMISSKLSISDIVHPSGVNENLYVVSAGPIPPNPAELILSDRMSNLIKELRTQFDYIILDAPPIGLVTDAQILADYSDLTLYVVRFNYTFKNQLNIINELNVEGKIPHMAIVLNDSKNVGGYGYYYGSYGGYGGYFPDEKTWFEKNIKDRFKR